MGVDIFMGWKGMTERDRERQFKEYFSGQAGSVGYLRASYGNDFSLKLLEKIFPRKYWENIEAPYPFLKYHNKNMNIIKKALKDIVTEAVKESSGKQTDSTENKDRQKSIFDVFSNIVEAHGEHLVTTEEDKKKLEGVPIIIPDYSDTEYKIEIIFSILEFLRLGEILEIKGKKPYIYISC